MLVIGLVVEKPRADETNLKHRKVFAHHDQERFICSACGKRGADVRPDFDWDKKSVGY